MSSSKCCTYSCNLSKEKNFSCEKYKEINNIEYLEESTDVNLTIVTNKDAKYAWRSLQLIHPILYVDLVRLITKEENWDELKSRFRDFQSDEKIICMSVPLESTGKKQDQAEQILNWWKNLEQAQIELALDYNYCLQTDITDCILQSTHIQYLGLSMTKNGQKKIEAKDLEIL